VFFALFLLLSASLLTNLVLPLRSAYSDSLTGGVLTQRIGNLDVELKTVPAKPLAGENTKIFLRIGSINGGDLTDIPITIKLYKQGDEIHKSNTIVIPYGHYTYSYEFAKPDTYGFSIGIQDQVATQGTGSTPLSSSPEIQNLLFVFPISVDSKPFVGLFNLQTALVLGTVFAVSAFILFALVKKRKITRKFYGPTGKI
jgi:hypothetical protein